MIDDREVRSRAEALGVTEAQIRRDHLLSHLIAALPHLPEVAFVGGTALNRTHLLDRRLSEDLDLYLTEENISADGLFDCLVSTNRREFPDLEAAARRRQADVATATLRSSGNVVRVQVISRRHEWSLLPFDPTAVSLFYTDLPDAVTLPVPTRAAFTALKLTAYVERRSPRDLYDLDGLLIRGRLARGTTDFVRNLLGRDMTLQELPEPPSQDEWETELGHQVRTLDPPAEAYGRVVSALAAAARRRTLPEERQLPSSGG